MYDTPRFLNCGDTALTIEIGNEISEEINKKIISIYEFLKESSIEGIEELLPTYCALTVFYDPLKCSINSLVETIRNNYSALVSKNEIEERVIEIPVIYGGQYGPDLERVCKHNNLTTEEVINIHCHGKYLVYMLGFTPGFPYLGGMNEKISTPRLEVPRKKILEGAVGIAGAQTGIYPLESPGGWNIIGQTPLKLFNSSLSSPTLLRAGDYVRFMPINEEEFSKRKEEQLPWGR